MIKLTLLNYIHKLRLKYLFFLIGICSLLDAQSPIFDSLGRYSVSFRVEHIPGQYEIMSNSRIYYPDSNNQIPQSAVPCPIVIFGHGYQMGIDRYYSYAQHLASWGYIVVLPTISNPFPTPEHYTRAHSMVDAARWTANRNFVIGDIFYNKLDPFNWGFVGHSMGGGIALLAADTFKLVDTLRAVVSFASPQTTPSTHSEHLLIPKMILAGSVDNIAPWQQVRQAYWQNAPAPGVFAVIYGANHGYFMDYSYFWENGGTALISRALQQKVSRRYMTAYFERYLHNDLSNWNYLFCYGDSLVNTSIFDTVEIRYSQADIGENNLNFRPDYKCYIFPNPVREYCYINCGNTQVKIFNAFGQLIKEKKSPFIWYTEKNLKNGVYFLQNSDYKLFKIILLR
ncbi:MAG: T9SS type A sorting domain-containing protein [candidate division WOR-3 bacterium]|nr:T9SS type A sorting domain-containing protein [candidate division WOR-3 bacterium]